MPHVWEIAATHVRDVTTPKRVDVVDAKRHWSLLGRHDPTRETLHVPYAQVARRSWPNGPVGTGSNPEDGVSRGAQ